MVYSIRNEISISLIGQRYLYCKLGLSGRSKNTSNLYFEARTRRCASSALSSAREFSRGATDHLGMKAPEISQLEDLPSTYKRLLAKSVGTSFREVATIAESKIPKPSPGEVLIKVEFVGINGGCETFRARGEYAFKGNQGKKNFPLGAEAVGIIVALGKDVNGLKVGQAVAASGAGYAQYAVLKAAMCFPLREASAEAVAVSLSGLTAAAALLHKGGLKASNNLLVTAAAGGTGHFAVQIGNILGCHTIATCGSREKAEKLKAVGVSRVINYHEEDVAEVLSKEYRHKIDIAYEGVGGPLRDAVLENLSPAGIVLAVGYISEYPHTRTEKEKKEKKDSNDSKSQAAKHTWTLPPADELMWQGQTIQNGEQIIFGQVWPNDPKQIMAAKEWLFGQYYAAKVEAWVDPKPFTGLASIVDATEYMLSGQSIGKVVVDLR